MENNTSLSSNSPKSLKSKQLESKVVILGEQGVGKTSVIMSYIGNNFSRHISPTIGASFFTCKLNLEDYHVKLQIWDTAGQERFRAMAPMYYRSANAAIIVFDLSSEFSFDVMKTWVSELKKNVEEAIVLCVLGNKLDLEHLRKVSKADAETYAKSIGALYFETSALNNEGIEEAFINTTLQIIEHQVKAEAELNYEFEPKSIALHKPLEPRYEPRTQDDGSYMFCC